MTRIGWFYSGRMGNAILIPKPLSEAAMDSAACIGCGACVAACKNASAHLFMGAKISHLACRLKAMWSALGVWCR